MSPPPDLSLVARRVEGLPNARPPARSPDINKFPTANAIRETRAKLTGASLRRLREGLFKLQLQLIQDLISGGISIPKVTAVSHCARTLEVVELLQADGALALAAEPHSVKFPPPVYEEWLT